MFEIFDITLFNLVRSFGVKISAVFGGRRTPCPPGPPAPPLNRRLPPAPLPPPPSGRKTHPKNFRAFGAKKHFKNNYRRC